MPKQKITKEQIMQAAFLLVKDQGYKAINARSIAKAADCSVQPIYSCCKNMEQLMDELFDYCLHYQITYVQEHLEPDNYFESAGRAHITFAHEEKNLFEFLFLSKYVKGVELEDVYRQYGLDEVTDSIEQTLGLDKNAARQLYLDMMIYTHGIAAMVSTGALNMQFRELHRSMERAFHAFLAKIREDGK